ncbi:MULTISPECIES: DoxX family protein [Haematobacter]|uniref:DoxX family protein n=1 Tax=Haematobacter genomosp. 1 TaxID=366618 RepID=A0A212A966_9RHOB|nr:MULTISPECIES: DoxX family protein [Haematobacter]OWJ76572.1 DoxX family protein [Haematobacter genomosp. 1]
MSHIQSRPGDAEGNRFFIPALQPVYDALLPVSETLLRVIAGFALAVHGWPKIQNPMGLTGMVESIGFAPSWFWAFALALTEFVGGILLLLGLFTRPAAAAATVVLLVTVWFHWVLRGEGYSGAELSLIWAGVTFFFVARGGGRYSLDRAFGREF